MLAEMRPGAGVIAEVANGLLVGRARRPAVASRLGFLALAEQALQGLGRRALGGPATRQHDHQSRPAGLGLHFAASDVISTNFASFLYGSKWMSIRASAISNPRTSSYFSYP